MKSVALLLFSLSATCFALEDTPANRAVEAERYLAATPPSELFADMAISMAKTMPEAQRQRFIDVMTKDLDVASVTKAMKESMVKTFSADELKALADFYSSAEGKSAMKKYGAFMAEVMPMIQVEVRKALAKSKEAGTSQEKP